MPKKWVKANTLVVRVSGEGRYNNRGKLIETFSVENINESDDTDLAQIRKNIKEIKSSRIATLSENNQVDSVIENENTLTKKLYDKKGNLRAEFEYITVDGNKMKPITYIEYHKNGKQKQNCFLKDKDVWSCDYYKSNGKLSHSENQIDLKKVGFLGMVVLSNGEIANDHTFVQNWFSKWGDKKKNKKNLNFNLLFSKNEVYL